MKFYFKGKNKLNIHLQVLFMLTITMNGYIFLINGMLCPMPPENRNQNLSLFYKFKDC